MPRDAARPGIVGGPGSHPVFGRAPDPTNWGHAIGGNGWVSNELQYYTDGALAAGRHVHTVGWRGA